MINIILCGGSGTRLWPLSRKYFPKQYVKLLSEESLLQNTIERNSFCDSFIAVTNCDQSFIVENQIKKLSRNINDFKLLLEPFGKNTAPAIAMACFLVPNDETVLVSPSDHLILNTEDYKKTIEVAQKESKNLKLITFGIKPEYPETGYGYIESKNSTLFKPFDVKSFREKPDLKTAKKYYKMSKFFWNSGMLVFKPSVYLNELKLYSPEIYEKSLLAFEKSKNENNKIYINKNEMSNIPSDSIDYAVLEKSKNVKIIPSNFGWSDLGSFDALYNIRQKDENKNTIASNCILKDSHNNLIMPRGRKIVTIGIDDSIIIDTDDALLISKRGKSQQVKEIVDTLKNSDDAILTEEHKTMHRPWGTYTTLLEDDNYKVKKLSINPNSGLMMQKHKNRTEHWVVLTGKATIQYCDKIVILNVNESTFIKKDKIHQLRNDEDGILEIMETQVGDHISEEDIETFCTDDEKK